MQYAVERQLRHRAMGGGTTEFLIKWAEYNTPTWTARTHVPEELVSRYARRLQRRTGKELTADVNSEVQS